MNPVAALEVLTAMITPAVLISAAGLLTLGTSNRLGRVVDRVRHLAHEVEALRLEDAGTPYVAEKKSLAFAQLEALTSRASLIQGGLTSFYVAVGLFVATSLAIGLNALAGAANVLPLYLGLAGAVCLLIGSLLLILEARLALTITRREMAFLRNLTIDD